MSGRNVGRTHRVFFEHNGLPPYVCADCGKPIEKIGVNRYDGNIHHDDHDKTNDSPNNLVVLHAVCHQRRHPLSDEARRRVGDASRGRKLSTATRQKLAQSKLGDLNPAKRADVRAKMSESHTGKTLTTEQRAKIGAKLKGVPKPRQDCPDCGKDWSMQWIRRHKERGWCIAT